MTAETSNARGEVVAWPTEAKSVGDDEWQARTGMAMHVMDEDQARVWNACLAACKSAAAPPPAAARGDVPYDRELIARMLDVCGHPKYTLDAYREQARLLRAADNASASAETVSRPPADAEVQYSPQAGEPPTWFDEWFIAETQGGERVVLRRLPKEWTYDYTTADGTYFKADRIRWWMQFPDSQFKPLEAALSQQPKATLLREQPCGCVLCVCEDEKQCHGCGARHCGNLTDHPAYVSQQPEARGVVDDLVHTARSAATVIRNCVNACQIGKSYAYHADALDAAIAALTEARNG